MVVASLALAAIPGEATQASGLLRIRVTVVDAEQRTMPVPRHALLISDEPPSVAPRRVVTTAGGTAEIRLRPGRYTVESDAPSTMQGHVYQWVLSVEVAAGRDTTLELTAANAEVGAATAGPDAASVSSPAQKTVDWQDSVVAIWTERRHTAGLVVSHTGYVATYAAGIADAASIEVQVSPTEKVAGDLVAFDEARDFALVAVHPSAVARVPPAPLDCPSAGGARAPVPQDLRTFDVPFFGANTATFDLALTGMICVTVDRMEQRFPVSRQPTARLPVEPSKPLPLADMRAAALAGGFRPSAYASSTSDFDVLFITPILLASAKLQQGRTGASNSPAALRPVVDFGEWTEYVEASPPVVFIRATPRRVESFWAKVARAAAYTQGARIGAVRRLGPGFSQVRVLCGTAEIAPIHPFRIRASVSDTEDVDEGFYAFDPMAIGPHCGTVSLVLSSIEAPDETETKVVAPAVIARVWNDFASYRER
jgi:hypothetical protein